MEYDLTLVNAAYALADRWYESRHITDTSQLDFKASDLDSLDANQRGVSTTCFWFYRLAK